MNDEICNKSLKCNNIDKIEKNVDEMALKHFVSNFINPWLTSV